MNDKNIYINVNDYKLLCCIFINFNINQSFSAKNKEEEKTKEMKKMDKAKIGVIRVLNSEYFYVSLKMWQCLLEKGHITAHVLKKQLTNNTSLSNMFFPF